MSEEQQEVTVEQLQEQLQQKDSALTELQSQFESMKNKTNELLDETKKAKNAKREAELVAAQEAEAKARKAGDFEQLLKSSEEQRHNLEEQLNSLQNNISQEKVGNAAMKMAAELADGANAEILAEFIGRRLKYTNDGLKVTDASGNLTVSSIAELASEFANNERYKSLLRGSKASGGGAAGSGGSAPENKIMDRADFEKLPAAKQMDFIKKGGTLT